MRLRFLLVIALLGAFLPVVLPSASAQTDSDNVVVTWTSTVAEAVVNGTVVSTSMVEVEGIPHRVSQLSVESATKGSTPSEIFVAVPGGHRGDGSGLYVSHTPDLEPGDVVQVALISADSALEVVIPSALNRSLETFTVVGGIEGVANFMSDGRILAEASSALRSYSWNGRKWPSFDSAVPYRINTSGSGLSSSAAVQGVNAGFARWEDDPGSDIDFNHVGSTASRGRRADGVNTVSWSPPSRPDAIGQAWVFYTGSTIVEVDILLSPSDPWATGAVPGRLDVASTVAHEVGHALGFDHVPNDPAQLMFPSIPIGAVKPLGSGDLAAAAAVYPSRSQARCNGLPVTVFIVRGESPTNGSDVILGSSGADVINGLGGNDVICGEGGGDTIDGGSGNDRILGGSGADTIRGGDGNDRLFGQKGNDKVYGGPGDDVISGKKGDDRLWGGPGRDDMTGGTGADIVYGGDGADEIKGGDGNDELYGGAGTDTIFGKQGNDRLFGNGSNDVLWGSKGNDTLDGGGSSDRCNGGPGSDSKRSCEA